MPRGPCAGRGRSAVLAVRAAPAAALAVARLLRLAAGEDVEAVVVDVLLGRSLVVAVVSDGLERRERTLVPLLAGVVATCEVGLAEAEVVLAVRARLGDGDARPTGDEGQDRGADDGALH